MRIHSRKTKLTYICKYFNQTGKQATFSSDDEEILTDVSIQRHSRIAPAAAKLLAAGKPPAAELERRQLHNMKNNFYDVNGKLWSRK